MAQETINSIREAELKAGQCIKDAEEEARRIVENAKAEAQAYEAGLIKEAQAKGQAALDEVMAGREEALEGARRRAMAVMAQHESHVETNRPAAVEFVISEITG